MDDLRFRGSRAAAPLKHGDLLCTRYRYMFPRLTSRGPIEARSPKCRGVGRAFPRLTSRGPIEAGTYTAYLQIC